MERTNRAAWIASANAKLEVKEAPYPTPGPNEIVVKTVAIAINPLEYKIQDYNPPIAGKTLSYPTILGADLAGTIVETGSAVTTLKVGQRVIVNCVGLQLSQPARSAFQEYVLLREAEPTTVPDHVPLTSAVVLPLAMETASAGLFTPDQLNLSTERLQDSSLPFRKKQVLLVWGGSSSVGCCAIQLAVAAGYQVFTTASKHNHALCSSLGAAQVLDHRAEDVEDQIISALRGGSCVGALDCVVDEEKTMRPLAHILAKNEGVKKIVAVLGPKQEKYADEKVKAVRVSIPSYRKCEAFGIVHEWMGRALADGTLKPKPDAEVVGEGLEAIQAGMDKLRGGVSAKKIIVKVSSEE